MVSPSTAKERNSQQTLESYLEPLIGNDAPVVAGQLLRRFGTISRAFAASPEALTDTLRQHRKAAAAICAARSLMHCAANEQLVGTKVDVADSRFHAYLRAKLVNPVEERMHAVFLDRVNMFIAAEQVAIGSSGQLVMRVRHVVHRALDLRASGILIAHNHPSGSSQPSPTDYRSTEQFKTIAQAIDLEIVDHLIVTQRSVFSMIQGKECE